VKLEHAGDFLPEAKIRHFFVSYCLFERAQRGYVIEKRCKMAKKSLFLARRENPQHALRVLHQAFITHNANQSTSDAD